MQKNYIIGATEFVQLFSGLIQVMIRVCQPFVFNTMKDILEE